MFTDNDYRAAAVRDPVRHSNESIERATKTGLTISLRVREGQPVFVTVESGSSGGTSRKHCKKHTPC